MRQTDEFGRSKLAAKVEKKHGNENCENCPHDMSRGGTGYCKRGRSPQEMLEQEGNARHESSTRLGCFKFLPATVLVVDASRWVHQNICLMIHSSELHQIPRSIECFEYLQCSTHARYKINQAWRPVLLPPCMAINLIHT
jgi:hypothetical protein